MNKLNRGDIKIGLLLMGLIVALTIVSYAIYSYSGGGSNFYPREDSEKKINYSTLYKTSKSAQKLPETYVLYGDDELRTIWERSFDGDTIPDVDFGRYTIAMVFSGEHRTSGYGVEIYDVTETDNDVFVYAREIVPGPSCKVSGDDVSPVHVVKFLRTDKPVTFISETKVISCN